MVNRNILSFDELHTFADFYKKLILFKGKKDNQKQID